VEERCKVFRTPKVKKEWKKGKSPLEIPLKMDYNRHKRKSRQERGRRR
jgi:hypothetical protein